MKYTWEGSENGQKEFGIVSVRKTTINGKNVLVVLNFLPQFENNKQQRVVCTLFLEGTKSDWTDWNINNIFYDTEEFVKKNQVLNFSFLNSLEYMDTQLFLVDKIPNIQYLSNGDFAFEK
ncbi:hypothetical protein [Parabacteroides johnsonii]|uniref:hypothetical protein n=1 Tax=Parabacteroides johnsonii TaxID=387661 RepID=UPI00243063BE|nr:hypothetical protein [Parabacteroides johnsonii]